MTLKELQDKYVGKIVIGYDRKSYKILNIQACSLPDKVIVYYKIAGQGNKRVQSAVPTLNFVHDLQFDTVYYLKNRRRELTHGRKSKG